MGSAGQGQEPVTSLDDIPALIDALCEMYDESVAALRSALARYLMKGERPDQDERAAGLFAYPELRIDYRDDRPVKFPSRAFGRLNQPGRYATSIGRPRQFRKYLAEQLEYLVRDYQVEVSVARSASEIPYPYVLDGTDDLGGRQGRTGRRVCRCRGAGSASVRAG